MRFFLLTVYLDKVQNCWTRVYFPWFPRFSSWQSTVSFCFVSYLRLVTNYKVFVPCFQSEWTEISIQGKYNILPYLLLLFTLILLFTTQVVPIKEVIPASWRNHNQKDARLKQSFPRSSVIADFCRVRNSETRSNEVACLKLHWKSGTELGIELNFQESA